MTQRIEDVDTGLVTDEPSGWSNPSGLHLVFDYEHDDLGRPTEELGPSHEVDASFVDTSSSDPAVSVQTARWWAYRDTVHELQEAWGYLEGGAYDLVNPVRVTRFDRAGRVTDAIEAVRPGTDGKLTGYDFSQGEYSRWTHYVYDDHGRLTEQRRYFSIPTFPYPARETVRRGPIMAGPCAGSVPRTVCGVSPGI